MNAVVTPGAEWIVRARPTPAAAVRLVAMPFAGGAASAYRSWAGRLPGWVELCALQLPGREQRHRERPLTAMAAMARAAADAVRPLADRPVAFFGHSMGAVIAYEAARLLAREGVVVRHLFASGRRAPQLPAVRDPAWTLPDAGLVAALRRLNGTPLEVLENAELLEIVLPVIRADFQAIETYVREDTAMLSCPVSALGGESDPDVDAAALSAWGAVTTGAFETRMFPGDHFYLNSQTGSLIEHVADRLAMVVDHR